MARITVQAVHADGEARRWTLSERIVAENLDSDHYVSQLLERLVWAAADAEAAESRSPNLAAAHGDSARQQAHSSITARGTSASRRSRIPSRNASPTRWQRWRQLCITAAATVLGAFPLVLFGASAADAASPTSPPPVTIVTSQAHIGAGKIFVTPTGDASTYANGPEIIDKNGNVLWFHPIPQGQTASDFRAQSYHGRPVLTWWQGTGLGGLASGTDYIYNDHFQQIATVNAGNGLSADGHEFLITPWNTALILSYTTATADLSSIGGPANQTVINGVVQEVNIATGKVLFQWNSEDHVPFIQSEQPLPGSPSKPWDWFHINAVHLDTDGNLLVDARDTWTTYKVNRFTGNIIWQLGGKASSFTLTAAPGQVLDSANEIFAWQHDPEALGDDLYTLFDNESAGTPLLPASRTITVRLHERTHVATLVASDNQPEGLVAASQGNAQTTHNGNLFVGWGSLPYFSEFDTAGRLLFNAQFPAGVNSYRAYLLPWRRRESIAAPPPSCPKVPLMHSERESTPMTSTIPRASRTLTLAAVAFSLIAATLSASASAAPTIDSARAWIRGHHGPRAQQGIPGVALQWYDITNQTVAAAAYPEPVTQSRAWSVSWLAAARAVRRSADPRFGVAAFAQALHDTLVAQVPGQQPQLDADLASTLAAIPNGPAKSAGIATGKQQASSVLAERQGDGLDTASVDIPFTPPPPGPGVWQPTPPAFAPAVRAGEGNANSFLLASNDQFDPGPPPALNSPTYLTALAEVRAYGSATSAVRTPQQTDVALFWEPAINIQYVQVLRAVLADTHARLAWQARFIAAFNAITTDAQIAIYNAKFKYLFWRPVTAIQTGSVSPDPSWTPLFTTPRHPDWLSGHGGVAGAAQQVLTAFLGPSTPAPIDVTSPTDPGSTHTYGRWSQITDEVIDARVWEGIHFRFSDVIGAHIGREVARHDLRRLRSIGL